MPPLKMDIIRTYIQSGSGVDDRVAIVRIMIQTLAFIAPPLFICNALLESGVLYYHVPTASILVTLFSILIVNRALYRIHKSNDDAHDESLYQKIYKKFGKTGVWFIRSTGFIYYQAYTSLIITIIAITTVNSSPGEDTGLFVSLILTLYLTVYALSRLSPESFQKVCTFIAGCSITVVVVLLSAIWTYKVIGVTITTDEFIPLNHSFNAEVAQVLLASMGFELMWRIDKSQSRHDANIIYTGSNLAIIITSILYFLSGATLFTQEFVLSLPDWIFTVCSAVTLPVGTLSAACAFIKSGDLLDRDVDRTRYFELVIMVIFTLIATLFIHFLPVLGGLTIVSAMLFFFIIALSDRQDFLSWLGAITFIIVAIFCLWDIEHIIILN